MKNNYRVLAQFAQVKKLEAELKRQFLSSAAKEKIEKRIYTLRNTLR